MVVVVVSQLTDHVMFMNDEVQLQLFVCQICKSLCNVHISFIDLYHM